MKLRILLFPTLLLTATAGSVLAHGADDITVQVGAGQDTTVISAYFPETVTVKVGQPVTFRLSGDEAHTVTFLGGGAMPPFAVPAADQSGELHFNPQVAFPTRMPGAPVETYDGQGFLNSGMLSHEPAGPDAPPNDHLTVVFTQPGTYEYACALHPWMKGTVVVEPEASAEVDSHEVIDGQAEAEAAALLSLADTLRHQHANIRSEPGPNGTTVWYVKAGVLDMATADPRATLFEFLPGELTIKAGDTVVWSSPEFHSVSFVPVPPGPEPIVVRPQEQGPPQLVLNPEVFAPVKPSGTYDPARYFNSGMLGPFTPEGFAWSLTFDQPGTYGYYCALHAMMGMEGTITVVPR